MLSLEQSQQLLINYQKELQALQNLIKKDKSLSDIIKNTLDGLIKSSEAKELSSEQLNAIQQLSSDLEARQQLKNLVACSQLDIQSKINLQKFLLEVMQTTVKIGDLWNCVQLAQVPIHFPNELMRDEFAKEMGSSVTLKNGKLFILGKTVWCGGPYDDEMPGEFVFDTKEHAEKFMELLQLENCRLRNKVIEFDNSLPMTCVLIKEEAKRQEALQLLEMKNQKIEEMVILSTNTSSFFNKVDFPTINEIANKIICSDDKPVCTVKSKV